MQVKRREKCLNEDELFKLTHKNMLLLDVFFAFSTFNYCIF